MTPLRWTELIERAERDGTPIVDDSTATFVWRGTEPVQVIGDFNGWNGRETGFAEVLPGVWAAQVTLPRDAYVEYVFLRDGQAILDPLNPRVTDNGLGATNNYLTMPDAEDMSVVKGDHGIPHGTLSRHVLASEHLVVGGSRAVHLYRPPTEEPVPLLVVFDGNDYLSRADLPNLVDNLIHQKRVAPFAMALVHHGGQARFVEYDCSDATAGFLVRHVIPLAQEQLNLLDPADTYGGYGVLGASMGGLAALYTALRLPDVFGRVISQSGSYGLGLAGQPSVLQDLIRCGETRPIRVWMDVGKYETLLNANRRMHALLLEKGYDVSYREHGGAHNYTSWRNSVWRGLENLFGEGAIRSHERAG